MYRKTDILDEFVWGFRATPTCAPGTYQRPPGATRSQTEPPGRDQGATARPRKATRSHRKLPEPARNHQMPPEGHQKAFWWPAKLDYHARGVAKRQTPPGGTGGHRKPPEGHLKVTLRPPGAPRGPQRPPGAIPTRISRERCCEKKVMAIPALFFWTGKLGVPLQKQASFGPE